MTEVSVPKNVWTSIVTASADTIVENLGHEEVFISTSPTYTNPEKLTITTLASGQTAHVYSVNKDTDIRYFAASGGGGGVSDGDKGDITVSGSGSTWTIDNNTVTLAKMADVATSSVFYRKTTGTGTPEVQTLATLKTDLGLTGTNSGDQTITLTGDVTGSGAGSFATTIANDSVSNTKLANMAANSIKGNNTGGSADPLDLTAAQVRTLINVADGANNYTHPNHSGDVTSVGDGATTIANNAVTNFKAADMVQATIKGRAVGAGTGDPTDLTATQATAILDVFTSSLKGLAPSSGGGTTNYLRADGTWNAPPGTGGGGAPAWMERRLAATQTLTNDTTVKNWFASASACPLLANSSYEFEGLFMSINGTTSHGLNMQFAALAGATIRWASIGSKVNFTTQSTAFRHVMTDTFDTARLVTTASAVGGNVVWIKGTVITGTAGNLTPRVAQSAASGSFTVQPGTYFKVRRLGTDTFINSGEWT